MSEGLLPREAELRKELEGELDEVDRLWRDYARRASSIADRWEGLKIELLEKISKTESLIRSIEEDLERIRVEVLLGLVSEEKRRDEVQRLENEQEKLTVRLKALQEFVELIETRLTTHLNKLEKEA